MKKRYIALIVFAVLVVALFTWRLCPRDLSSLLPEDAYAFTCLDALATDIVYTGSSADFRTFRLEDGAQTDGVVADLLDILKTSDYRPSFRNLLPWTDGSMISGNDYDGRSATVHFYIVQDQTPRYFYVQFFGRSQVAISSGDDWGVYHATNPETLTALVEYIHTHGKMQ